MAWMLETPRRLSRVEARRFAALEAALTREWRSLGPDLDASWRSLSPRVAALVSAAQVAQARDGWDSVGLALAEADTPVDTSWTVAPEAWAGFTVEGNPLDSLLYGSVIEMRKADAPTFEARKQIGLEWLKAVAVEEAGAARRGAAAAAVGVRQGVGYTRVAGGKCCKKCAPLVGRFFRWNQGFLRHPGCLCKHVAVRGGHVPEGYVDKVGPEDIRDLTKAERASIDAGADMNQVLNARRGRKGDYTLEGTRRGHARSALTRTDAAGRTRQAGRMTPQALLLRYGDDREQFVAALRRNGYIR